MNVIQHTRGAFWPLASLLVGITACSGNTAGPTTGQAPVASDTPEVISFLAFGDSGNHFDFPSKKDLDKPIKNRSAWYKKYNKSRVNKGYREQDRILPNIEFNPLTGGYVLASGLGPVASAMRDTCVEALCQFALMLGDNIYPSGANGVDDQQRFDDILKIPFSGLGGTNQGFKIYATLGNHDWNTSREGAMAQVSFMQETPPFYMDGIFYSVIPEGLQGKLEIFVVDTQVLLGTTEVLAARLDEQGQEIANNTVVDTPRWSHPQGEAEWNMLQWLERSMQQSDANWKIVIGHHPLWSAVGGKYAQSVALRELLVPILCRYADAYFSGHEHTLELHEQSCSNVNGLVSSAPFPQIVSGAASKQREINDAFSSHQDESNTDMQTLFHIGSTWGFAYVTLTNEDMIVEINTVDTDGGSKHIYTHSFTHRSK